MIATEIALPEPLFRRLQAHLDLYPTESIDSLFAQALEVYFSQRPIPFPLGDRPFPLLPLKPDHQGL
jgi:hypothetical protein